MNAWTFALGDWKLHLRILRDPEGKTGLDLCTVPPLFVPDEAAGRRLMVEMMAVIEGVGAKLGNRLPATERTLAVLVPALRTWVEDAVRRGACTWAPQHVELFGCHCHEAPPEKRISEAELMGTTTGRA